MRWLLLILCVLLIMVVGCLRDVPDAVDDARTATHPWDLPGYEPPPELARVDDAAESDDGAVEQPVARGPKLSEKDTLDPDLLAGRWLQVCYLTEEKVNQSVVGNMNILELQPGGTGRFTIVYDNEGTPHDGSWSKIRPGVISMAFGEGEPVEMYGEIYNKQFLYLWNYARQQGLWFARLPKTATERIEANRFNHTRGELHLVDIVQKSYQGVISGESEITVGGYYESGVLTMTWEDAVGNIGGVAAYIVSPDWGALDGVWWIDDWEAAPFGGTWTATRK